MEVPFILKKNITAYHCIYSTRKILCKKVLSTLSIKIIRGEKWCPPGHTSPTVKPHARTWGQGPISKRSEDPYPHSELHFPSPKFCHPKLRIVIKCDFWNDFWNVILPNLTCLTLIVRPNSACVYILFLSQTFSTPAPYLPRISKNVPGKRQRGRTGRERPFSSPGEEETRSQAWQTPKSGPSPKSEQNAERYPRKPALNKPALNKPAATWKPARHSRGGRARCEGTSGRRVVYIRLWIRTFTTKVSGSRAQLAYSWHALLRYGCATGCYGYTCAFASWRHRRNVHVIRSWFGKVNVEYIFLVHVYW